MVVVGAVVAIVVIKQLFGGMGQNFINPALGARVFLFISYANRMTNWVIPGTDAVSSATPLGCLRPKMPHKLSFHPTRTFSLATLEMYRWSFCSRPFDRWNIPCGKKVIGRKYFDIHRNLGIVYMDIRRPTLFSGDFVYHILSGGLLLGAIYMATDYTTSPMTPRDG